MNQPKSLGNEAGEIKQEKSSRGNDFLRGKYEFYPGRAVVLPGFYYLGIDSTAKQVVG